MFPNLFPCVYIHSEKKVIQLLKIQNTIVNLMPEYLCGVLMKGSETLSLETNKDMFFSLLTNPGVSIKTLIPLHTTSIHIQKYLYYISSLKQ